MLNSYENIKHNTSQIIDSLFFFLYVLYWVDMETTIIEGCSLFFFVCVILILYVYMATTIIEGCPLYFFVCVILSLYVYIVTTIIEGCLYSLCTNQG